MSDEVLVLADAMQEGLLDVVDRMVDAPVLTWKEEISLNEWYGYAEYLDGTQIRCRGRFPGPRNEELLDEAKVIVQENRIKSLLETLPDYAFIEIRDQKICNNDFRNSWRNKYKLPFYAGFNEGKRRGIIDKKRVMSCDYDDDNFVL